MKKKFTNSELIKYYSKRIYEKDVDIKTLLINLKRKYSAPEILKVIKAIDSHPFVKKYFYGTIKVKEVSDLGASFYIYIDDIEKELEICSLTFKKYSKELTEFVRLKGKFEDLVLFSKFEEATQILDEVLKKFGFSLWLIENKLLLEELKGGLTKNWEYLNFVTSNSSSPFVSVLANFYSLRAEKKISAPVFSNKVATFLNDLDSDLSDYLKFRLLGIEDSYTLNDLKQLFLYDSVFPIVDRYLTFTRISQIVVSNPKHSNFLGTLRKVVLELNNDINDISIKTLSVSFGLDCRIIHDEKNRELFNQCFDDYLNADYDICMLRIKSLIKSNLYDFSLIDLYCKCVIENHDSLSSDFSKYIVYEECEDSLINSIFIDTCTFLSKSNQSRSALTSLLKKSYVYQSANWGNQLYSFLIISASEESDEYISRLYYLNSICADPLYFQMILDGSQKAEYLRRFDDGKISHLLNLIRIYEFATDISSVDRIQELNIKQIFKDYWSGMILLKLNLFQEAALVFENLIQKYKSNIIIYESSLVNLLLCYKRSCDYNKYFQVYTDAYLLNYNYVYRADLDSVPKEIIESKFENIQFSIDFPIFLKITNQRNQIVNTSIRQFLKKNNLKRFVDVVDLSDTISLNKLTYFLFYVCTPEILKYFIFYKSTKSILSDRLEACKVLLDIDQENENLYKNEINSIVQKIVFLDGIKEVDDSKIYVDEKGLRDNGLTEVKNNFYRYVEVSNMFNEIPMFFIDLSNSKTLLVNFQYNTEDVRKSIMADEYKFELFKELFLGIRKSFLFNDIYGLDSYLSTRIRHGTLLGQIRSQFQEQFLITFKNKVTSEYDDNEFWAKKYQFILDEDTLFSLQNCFSEFSKKIDALTSRLKSVLIQIKVDNRNNAGLFDYDFSEKDLRYLYDLYFIEINEYSRFIDIAFQILWDRTAMILESIRNHIANEIRNEYVSYLDELESKIKKIVNEPKKVQELLSNIITCRTSISYEIDKIANWFQIKNSKIEDFEIAKAINTSLEIVNKISKVWKLNIREKNINSVTRIQGKYFIHIFDLITIFLDNIVKYSATASHNSLVNIFVVEDNDILSLKISNTLSKETDLKELSTRFKTKLEELDKPDWEKEKINKEEGTGFFKAKKTLLIDLECLFNRFGIIVYEEGLVEIDMIIHLQNIKA